MSGSEHVGRAPFPTRGVAPNETRRTLLEAMAITLIPARRYVFFVLAALSLMMFSIDSTIITVTLPTMTADLRTNLVWIGWTLTAYQLTQTIVLPLAGKLAESFGRARVFLTCMVLFTLGSL